MAGAGYGNHDEGERVDEGRTPPSDRGRPSNERPSNERPSKPQGDDRRETVTPGDGAGASGPQGDEVDPGVG